jgi:DNA-binding MarR family transcriptional regulator
MPASLAPGPRRRNSALEAVERVRRAAPQMNLTQVVAFLYVCENEGLNVSELALICRTTRATASRTAHALAVKGAAGALAPYAGLLELRPNPAAAHGQLIYLSPAGLKLRVEIDGVIARAQRILPVAHSNMSVTTS